MKNVLGVKNTHRAGENDKWLAVWDNIESYVSNDEVEASAQVAINRLKKEAESHERIGYAWSGGKDSLVIHDLIKRSGIPVVGGVFVQFENEYPSFLEWLEANQPSDCDTVDTGGAFSLEYLDKHPEYLFPVDPKCKAAYNSPRWKPQAKWAKDNGCDLMLFGRRTIDGNHCGNGFRSFGGGVEKYSFIADWSQEEVLGYLRYRRIGLPPFYFYRNGFVYGTYPWTVRERVNGSYFDTFDELMGIDPRIVPAAADRLSLAREYMDERRTV